MAKVSNIFKGDRVIWAIFFFLCAISLVEVFSAASTLTYKSGSFWMPMFKQALFLGLGTAVVIAFQMIQPRFFQVIPVIGLPITLLFLVFSFFLGASANDAQRWVDVGFIQFQPSELAKCVMVLTTALILSRLQRDDGADPKAIKYVLIITGIIELFIFTENLSTAALLFAVIFLMMYIGRVPFRQLGSLLGVMAIVVALVLLVVALSPSSTSPNDSGVLHRFSTWKARITKHFGDDKQLAPEDFDIDKDAQVAHANIAIASSNVVGKLPGNSIQRDFLSQAYSDFIYAIIIEELGIWGGAIVVILYIWLLFRAGRIAARCRDMQRTPTQSRYFYALTVMGAALMLVLQALFNMLVAVGIAPVTGQPLPLISRGGTSTLINCFYIGIILSISRLVVRRTKVKAAGDKQKDATEATSDEEEPTTAEEEASIAVEN